MTTAYPLTWPENWPRTIRRTISRFQVTFGQAHRDLIRELKSLGATNVVISSNMELRNDGLPYAAEANKKLADPGVAVYFLLKKRAMVMARDLYQTPAANLRCIGCAVHDLRMLEQHGGSFMMERAFSGFAALPNPSAAKPWWEVLGVSKNANPPDIIHAHRKLAQKYHPDNGGDGKIMIEINVAKDAAMSAFG